MKLLQEAMRRAQRCASPRGLAVGLLALVASLMPTAALAGEESVQLRFSNTDHLYLGLSGVFGIIAIIAAVLIGKSVLAHSAGSAKMQEVGLAIREGALAYLLRQVKTMIWFVIALAIGLVALNFTALHWTAIWVAVSFVGGVAASYIAGYSGMLMAVNGNMRTANAALTSYKTALEVAFRSGAVAGLVTVGMGLIGATVILWAGGSQAMQYLIGFGFGGSLAALFMRVGGGIFTKAADVGADLVGKVEAGIPEDDPRNPATIADNVGDNVGDCAGMAADIFESYEVTLVAAIVLGAATASIFDQSTWMKLIMFALMARGIGIIASIVGIIGVRGSENIDADPLKAIRKGFYLSAGIAALLTLGLAWYMMGGPGSPGKPIQTSRWVSQQATLKAQVLDLLKGRDRVALEKKVEPTSLTAADLKDLPELKKLNLDQQRVDQLAQMLPTLKAKDIEDQLKVPTGTYTLLDPTSNSPILDYSVPVQGEGTNPKFVSLREYLTSGKLKALEVQRTMTQQPNPQQPNAPTTTTTQKMVAIPPDAAAYEKSLADQNKSNPAMKQEVLHKDDAFVFTSPEGDLVLGVATPTQPFEQVDGQLTYFKAPPAEVQKKYDEMMQQQKTNPTAPPVAMPPQEHSSGVGTIEHTSVPWYMFFLAIAFGLGMAFAIEMLTDYYVSTHKKPVQEVAGVSSAGPAPMIIQGFAYALESSVFMVFALVFALLMPLFFFPPSSYGGSYILSFYGIALVGLGLLTTTGYVLAMDTFGPISDNAQGVYEMSGEGHDNELGMKAVQRLDAAGNTTKALTKGFAIATAVVAAVALFHSYLDSAKLNSIGLRLDIPEIFLGLLIGGAAPFLFSAFAINAVGRASFQLINEVRRQFREDAGIMAGTSKPNYGRCVAIVTAAAQKELLGPGILAISLPVAVAFGFSIGKEPTIIGGQAYNLVGAQALGGFLAGAILTGQLMAVLLANSGGMWDNAKKLIEDGLYGGKGTEAHKAGVVCDTVGDPFKDTAGPALNPLIKVMNLVALLLAAVVIQPFNNTVLAIVTLVAVAALAFSVYFSKKGSLSTALQAAATEAGTSDYASEEHKALVSETAPATPKRKITVDDPEEETEPLK